MKYSDSTLNLACSCLPATECNQCTLSGLTPVPGNSQTPCFLTVLPSVAPVKAIRIDMRHGVDIRPMEEALLIVHLAILNIHDFFLCLVAVPEICILYPLNLQIHKEKYSARARSTCQDTVKEIGLLSFHK